MKIVPVVLSGGPGTRLWPLSRKHYPKQFQYLAGENTMLQETLLRLNGLGNLESPIIICNDEHRFLVAQQLQQIDISNPVILLEPAGRNTAPALLSAALQITSNSNDALMLVLPTDHVIEDTKGFHYSIGIARQEAEKNKLITFGICPTDANTGYGYIKIDNNNEQPVYKVEKFVEKPDKKRAKSYLESGNYLWNSGMFMFRASALINELAEHYPSIIQPIQSSFDNSSQDLDFIRLEATSFKSCSSISIDFAIMEKSDNVFVIPLDVKWSDIGSWSALYEIGKKDIHGNVIKGDVLIKDTSNSYIYAENHVVATLGVKDLVIVDTPNALLIANKDKAQDIGEIVNLFNHEGREEGVSHRKVYRPWGWFDSIEKGDNFQVKRLHVNPGAKLSLQKHSKRAEHWVVVKGTATATNGQKVLTLKKGDSTYIPLGVRHMLENKTDTTLEIIEVQSGSYLGEDDIIRFEDIYSRI